MNRLVLIILLIFISCGKNEIETSNLPITYKSYNDNAIERLFWKFKGIDTINYGGILTLHKDSYTYNGCYCIVNGVWKQKRDTLFLYHIESSYDSSKTYIESMDCSLLDSIYQIKKEGTMLKVLNNKEGHLQLYSSEH